MSDRKVGALDGLLVGALGSPVGIHVGEEGAMEGTDVGWDGAIVLGRAVAGAALGRLDGLNVGTTDG